MQYNAKHRLSYHPLYGIWSSIKQRCYNLKHKAFKNYGGRSIKMCERWLNDPADFIKWALVNGYKKGLTIERKNNDGSYEPKNCKFATRKEQAQNRRPRNTHRWFVAVNKRMGIEHRHYSQDTFAQEMDLNPGHISSCLNGRLRQHKGWIFEWLIPSNCKILF